MRGAAFVYAYSRDPALYAILAETVRDMISAAEDSGRISSYPIENEFDAWDIWCRKYVLLGMQYFLEICNDEELVSAVTECMCRQLDYIIGKIGSREDGKKPITSATHNWRGLNSSSLLEPVSPHADSPERAKVAVNNKLKSFFILFLHMGLFL